METVYECSLSAVTVAKAKRELREDDEMREHGLGAMRSWIAQHPFISGCRTDAVFLLRFLRCCKFSIPQAQELLERCLAFREIYILWYRNLSVDEPIVNEIIDLGCVVPLSQRDSEGRQFVITRLNRMDPHKYTAGDFLRTVTLIIQVCLEDEETQVCGAVHVADLSGITISHLALFSFADIRVILKSPCICVETSTTKDTFFAEINKSLPLRLKGNHVLHLPGFAKQVFDFFNSVQNEKMRKRFKAHADLAGLKEVIDPSVLPKEYGGTVPIKDMIAEFKTKMAARREAIESLEQMHIKIVPGSKLGAEIGADDQALGVAGHFRKLELD